MSQTAHVGQAAPEGRRYTLEGRYREGVDALRRFRRAVAVDPPEAVKQNGGQWGTLLQVVRTVQSVERRVIATWERGEREEAVRMLDNAVPTVESLSRRIEAQRGALAMWWRSEGVRRAREELIRFAQDYVIDAPRRAARAVSNAADDAGDAAFGIGKALLIGGGVLVALLVLRN